MLQASGVHTYLIYFVTSDFVQRVYHLSKILYIAFQTASSIYILALCELDTANLLSDAIIYFDQQFGFMITNVEMFSPFVN